MDTETFQNLSLREQRHYVMRLALPNIPFDGWTWDALIPVERDLKLPNNTVKRLFDFKETNMVVVFADIITQDMVNHLNTLEKPQSVTERIALALQTRFHLMEDHKNSIRLLVNTPKTSFKTHPQTTWQTADAIWSWAGDTSKDYNYYTKRTLLAGIYTTAILYWLSDDSPHYEKTHAFINRQLDTIVTTGKTVKSALNRLGTLTQERRIF